MYCWARYLFVLVVIALGILSMLEACGQKGPLYLPPPIDQEAPAKKADKPTDVPTPPTPPQTPAPAPSPDLMAWPMGSPIENQ
jgi:predicted small lipoprotein YifL